MNYRKLTLCLVLGFLTIHGFSQSFQGKVLDDRGEPVPFAHVIIQGTYQGTITNADGRFQIYTQLENPILEVSCVGYKRKEVAVSSNRGAVIRLNSEEKVLNDVVIVPKNYALKLLKAAINSIPKNYPTETEHLTAFVRQSAQSPIDRTSFYEIELSLGLIKKGYGAPGEKKGIAKILQSRKLEFQTMDSLSIRFYGGAHLSFWGDLVARRLGPLNFSKIDGYWVEVADTLVYDGKRLFKVTFEPLPKSPVKGSGSIFVQDSTYAITRFELDYNEKECAEFAEDLMSPLRNYKRKYRQYQVNYSHYQDAWRLSDINYRTGFDKENEPYLDLEDQLIVTDIKTVFEEIPYIETVGFHEITLDKVGVYDSTFWDGQNTLIPSQDFQQKTAMYSIRDTSKSQTKQERIFSFLKRFYSNYGFGATFLYAQSAEVTHSYVTRKVEKESGYLFYQSIGFGFLINDFWAVEGMSKASFVSSTFSSISLSLLYRWNLNPKGRPVYLNPNLSVGYQQWMNHLQKVNASNPFMVNSKKFIAENVDVYLAEKSLSVMPGLKLSIEKSRRWSFFVSAAHNFTFFPSKGLYFSEDKYFGKTTFLKESDPDLSIQSGSDMLFQNSWQFEFGAVWKL